MRAVATGLRYSERQVTNGSPHDASTLECWKSVQVAPKVLVRATPRASRASHKRDSRPGYIESDGSMKVRRQSASSAVIEQRQPWKCTVSVTRQLFIRPLLRRGYCFVKAPEVNFEYAY